MANQPRPPPLPPEPFRLGDTPPSGTPTLVGLPRPALPPLPPPAASSLDISGDTPGPKDVQRHIEGLRAELVYFREWLPQQLAAAAQSGQTAPAVPLTPVPPSRKQAAVQVVGVLGKWTTIVMGVLGLAATVAHQFRPDLEGPIQFLIKLLGGTP